MQIELFFVGDFSKECPHCHGKLHQANYQRKPRGFPFPPCETVTRYSFCCSICRKRCSPPSIIFFGRFVYSMASIVLLCSIAKGHKAQVSRTLSKLLHLDRRTLARWNQWWDEWFAKSPAWKKLRALLPSPIPSKPSLTFLAWRFRFRRLDRLLDFFKILATLPVNH